MPSLVGVRPTLTHSPPQNSADGPDSVGAWTARVLQPPQWADRRPWYTYTLPDGTITFDSNSPRVMDAEIALSVANGVDHWGAWVVVGVATSVQSLRRGRVPVAATLPAQ